MFKRKFTCTFGAHTYRHAKFHKKCNEIAQLLSCSVTSATMTPTVSFLWAYQFVIMVNVNFYVPSLQPFTTRLAFNRWLLELRFYISLNTKIGHFVHGLPGQSLGIVLKKRNLTQLKETLSSWSTEIDTVTNFLPSSCQAMPKSSILQYCSKTMFLQSLAMHLISHKNLCCNTCKHF